MTTVAESILPALELARSQAGVIGWHIHTVDLLTETWSGLHTGDGTETVTTRRLLEHGQNPRVRWLTQEELALGNLETGTCEIGPMTPMWVAGDGTSGGVALAWFGDTATAGQTVHLIVTGIHHPTGAKYRIHHTHQERPTKIELTCIPVSNA